MPWHYKTLTGIGLHVLAQKLHFSEYVNKNPKNQKMKTFNKIIVIAFVLFFSVKADAQSRKVIYNDNEITLPNFLQYHVQPVDESAIQGKMDNNLIYISWQTTAETNTSHFELQRSDNGKDFEPIETITAGRISKNTRNYQTTDEGYSTIQPKMYYRLKTVFTNGKESFTNAIMLDLYTSATTVYNLDKK